MANTYTLIASNTLGSSAASVTFSSIPSTYSDLVLRCSIRSTGASTLRFLWLRYNGSSALNYSRTELTGDGTAGSSSRDTNVAQLRTTGSTGATSTANTFSNVEIYIPSYTSSNNKTASAFAVTEENGTTAYIQTAAFLRSITDSITQLDLLLSSNNFDIGSSFFLYGIKNS